ncbi:MAG TPA: hypothetical protein VFA63_07385 [Pseudonocardiaceae bacterium]|nr:hypothetical protein [Pseudonocardiaceae bacterium]
MASQRASPLEFIVLRLGLRKAMPIDPPSASGGGTQRQPTAPLPASMGTGACAEAVKPVPSRVALELTRADQLSGARQRLRGWAIGIGIAPDVAHDISAASYEAMANAIEHAYL